MLDSPSASATGATDADLARTVASQPAGAALAEEAELYRRFAPRVRLYGLKHLRDRDAADDLAQQVMLVAIERLRAGEVRNPEGIGSFILGTSRLMAGALQRTARRRDALLAHFGSMAPVAAAADPADLDRLEKCLQALRERERTILVLTFYAETPGAQIAAALGCAAGAVRVARHRALLRMRECMNGGTG